MNMNEKQKLREMIIESLGGRPYVFQSDAERQKIDGITNGSFANLASKGKGPAGGFYVGRRKAYPVEAYVDWILDRIHRVESHHDDAEK